MANSVDPDWTARVIWIYTVCKGIGFGGLKGLIANTRSVCIAVERLATYLGTQISYDVSLQTSFFYLARHIEFGITVNVSRNLS